ncbi:uncharacterized protein GIQ15_04862 [Arthroderma uncinatum]|uniref:uncharacterized protein n=1 Tax=Arthroderma uncinatum TaxID=74035 RepID=UPI00144A83DE|nr:uncharacterized protein GIQ15_04862 [Arthroderma uncinatum]KAF3482103.1 hypothetical protein GIQ15_04862 [Arthroderma uncinatum]
MIQQQFTPIPGPSLPRPGHSAGEDQGTDAFQEQSLCSSRSPNDGLEQLFVALPIVLQQPHPSRLVLFAPAVANHVCWPRTETPASVSPVFLVFRRCPRLSVVFLVFPDWFERRSYARLVILGHVSLPTSSRETQREEQEKALDKTHFRSNVDRPAQLKAPAMFLARRAVGPARRALLQRQQPRRFDSHSAHHHEPVNEHLGRGFYVAVASIPIGLALYKYSTSDASAKPWLTSVIEAFTENKAALERSNALHTRAIEQAGADRHLFASEVSPLTIDLSFPELFNTGSPINMSPGNSSGDLTAVVAHYEKRQAEMEKARIGRMKDGKVQSLYEDGRYF